MRNILEVVNAIADNPLYKNSMHNDYTNSIVTSYVQNICPSVTGSNLDIVKKIYKYIKSTVRDRNAYYEYFYGESDEFDKKELVYRTAFAAFIKKRL